MRAVFYFALRAGHPIRGMRQRVRVWRITNATAVWMGSLTLDEALLAESWSQSHPVEGVQGMAGRVVNTLSGHQRQRVQKAVERVGVYARWSKLGGPVPGISPLVGRGAIGGGGPAPVAPYLMQAVRDAILFGMATEQGQSQAADLQAPLAELVKLITFCRADAKFAELATVMVDEFDGDVADLMAVEVVTAN